MKMVIDKVLYNINNTEIKEVEIYFVDVEWFEVNKNTSQDQF